MTNMAKQRRNQDCGQHYSDEISEPEL
jgi:hypothetical protein